MGIVIRIDEYRGSEPLKRALKVVEEECAKADEHEENNGIGAVTAFDVLEAWKVVYEAATNTRRHYLRDIRRSGAVVKAALLRKDKL